ncbi:uncharacterized protein LOC135701132 [Ochlerotatus camptorhynchus]|uniref:uncharacterized protein LOC135701132 n=1 Tax=Ochlerotatus camptorhynchus TaxID=644619 RepID=UPI0031DDC07A
MRNHGILLVVLVLAPVCLATPGVGEFFEKLFGVFKPEGIVVTDAPENATDSASNDTAVEFVTETVITELDNDTEVISAKLTSVVVESLIESEEVTSEAPTDEDTISSSTPSPTTTVVYKLFHPNATTTASPTTTTAPTTVNTFITEATENTTHHLTESTAEISTKTTAAVTTSITTATEDTTQLFTESTAETTATSTISSAPESHAAALAPSLASTAILDNVLCKTTYNAVANLKITSCTSSTTPKTHRKRSADHNVEPLLLADTIQSSGTPEDNYPSSSEIGDDDGDVFPWDGNGEYVSGPINTYG